MRRLLAGIVGEGGGGVPVTRFILLVLALCVVFSQESLRAAYIKRYSVIDSGAITFTGNTLGLSKANGTTAPGTNDGIGVFITTDSAQLVSGWSASSVGGFSGGTTTNWLNNNSAAKLSMPAGSTVLYAELIWGGSAKITGSDVTSSINGAVNFTTPDGVVHSVSPDPSTSGYVNNSGNPDHYVRSANVTSFVQANGAGVYAAGKVPATLLASNDSDCAAGWTLAVVYKNVALAERNMTLFIGAEYTSNANGPISSVVGFCTPSTGTVNARLFASVIEGDTQKTGDSMKFGITAGSMTTVSGPNNPVNNFFASQINGDNGSLNSQATYGNVNHVAASGVGTVGGRQGWDITSIDVSSLMQNNQNTAFAQGVSSLDRYTINALALQIDVGHPLLSSTQTVDKVRVYAGETLHYTVMLTNSGDVDAVNLVFKDPLPFGTSFVTNSLATNGVTVVGANPIDGVSFPGLKAGAGIKVEYTVNVDQVPISPPPAQYVTGANWTYQFQSCVGFPLNNSTVVDNIVSTYVPRLEPSKTANLTNTQPNVPMTYTITVPNTGTTNTVGTTLVDPIPVGVTYTPGTTKLNGNNIPDLPGGLMPYSATNNVNNNLINSPGKPPGEIYPGQPAVITFNVVTTANPPPRIQNNAVIDADGANGVSPIQTTTANVSPLFADLAVGISDGRTNTAAGAIVNYVVSVTNLGPHTISNYFSLSLPLSSDISSVTYATTNGTYNPNTSTWNLSSLASNQVVTLLVSGVVSPTATSNIVSQAIVVVPTGWQDLNTNNNIAIDTDSIVYEADLGVTVTDGVTNVYQGYPLTYTITVTNGGPSVLSSIVLSNSIATNALVANQIFTPSEGVYNEDTGLWNGLAFGKGDVLTLTINATVLSGSVGNLTNLVSVSPPSGTTDTNPANNTASDVDVILVTADIIASKTGPDTVLTNSNYSYAIAVTNLGPSTASNVVIVDKLPAGVTFVSATLGGTYNATSNTVTWPSIASFASAKFTNFTVTVKSPTNGVYVTNILSSTSTTADPKPENNNGTGTNSIVETVVSMLTANIQTTKTGPTNVVAGTNFTYTITVTNLGPKDASNVVVVDTLPSTVTFVSASGSGSNANNVVTWPLITSFPTNYVTNLTVTVTAPGSGPITNVAFSSADTFDPTNGNNNGSSANAKVVSTVAARADIVTSKTGPSLVAVGSNIIYSIAVTNLGPSAASNVVIKDTLPTNVTFVSATGTFARTNNLITWTTIANFPSDATTNFVVTVTAPAISANITNMGSSTSATIDPIPGNNDGTGTNGTVVTFVSPAADVRTTKTGPANVFAGTNFSYTITVTNIGPMTASNVVVSDVLPGGVTGVTPSAGGSVNNGIVTWTISTLTNRAITNLTLTVTAPGSGLLTNTVSSGASTYDPVPDNNDGSSTNAIVLTTITPQADIATTKSGPTAVFANDNFTYLVTVTNMGPSAAANLIVSDTFPTNVSIVSVSGNGTYSSNLLTWGPIPVFASGASTNFSITVTAPLSGTFSNKVSSTNDIFDPVAANNNGTATNAIVTTTVLPQADLFLTKTGPTNVTAGTNFTYSISLTNLGPSAATSLVVTDALPAGFSFVTASAGFTYDTNGIVTWPIAAFANGAATNLSVTVMSSVGGTFTNRASVGSATFDPISTNNNGTAANAMVATTVIPGADLQVTKIGPTNVFVGTNFTYTITLTNMGPSTASSIIVTDALPAGVTFSSATAGYTLTNGLLTWPIVNLTNGGSTNFSVTVTAPNSPATLTNRASAGAAEFDPTPSNNNGSSTNAIVATRVTPKADLHVTKTGLTNVFAGTNFTYTISLTNTGPSTATSVIVTDTLPATVTFVSASAGFTFTNGLVTWPIAAFTNGAATNLTVTVLAPASGTLTNRASVGGVEFDPVTGDNDGTSTNATVITTITPQADLAVTKTGLTNVFAGTNFTYTITLTNIGPSTASGVVVTDALPSNVTFVTASTGFTFTNGLVTWSVPSFTNAASSNFTVTVTAPASGTLTNRVSTGGSTFDPVPANNNGAAAGAIVTTTITPQADLQTTKTGPTNVFAGTNFSYTITLTNSGPSTATSLVVTDTLPTGVTFVSATAGYGLTNGILTWPLATFTNGASSNFTVTVTAPASGTLTNRVSSGSQTFDQVPANNDGSAAAAIVTTTITPQADLQITKTGPSTAFASTNLSYTITLTNMGPSTVSGVVVTDALPVGVTFVTATPGFTFTNGLVTWPLAFMTNGAATNFTVTVTAPANSASLTNVVSGGSSTFDPVPNNNDGSAVGAKVTTTITPIADIQTTKTGPANVFAATNFTYTIAVTNIGPSTAANLFVTDALPASVTFVSASGSPTVSSNRVVWQIPSFTNTAVTNFTVTVTAPSNGATLTNVVSGGSDTLDPVPANNNGTNATAIVTTTVTPQANLASAKTGPANVFAGTNFNYNITLTNLGPSTVTSVVVTDTLPASVTFVSASGGGTFTNGMVTWPIASLTNGAVTNFTISVMAPTSGSTVTNRVSSGSPIFDPVPGNNDGSAANAIVTTTITPVADLQVTKTGPATAFASTNFSYTITLTNMGPSTASGVVVTDALPVGVTFVTATRGFTFTNGLVTWPLSTMTNGAVTNFTVTVTAPSNSATLTNVVSGGSSTLDLVLSNNDGSAVGAKVTTTITPIADIQTTKTGPANVFAATNFTYTIAVTNIGPSTAANLFVTDALPASVTFVSASGSPTVSSNRVVWQIPSFTNAASTNFSITVTAPANGTTLTNVVFGGSDTLDPVPTNNNGSNATAIVTTTVTSRADLASAKTGPAGVLAGTNFNYNITLTNLGPSTATSVVVTDALPASVTFVSASSGGTFTNGMVTWPIASLTNGAVTNFTIMVTAPPGGTVTNRVSSGSPMSDPNPGNNDGTAANAIVTTAITPVADLQATKTGPASVFAATNFSYTITLTNLGPSAATGIVVTDSLPAGVTFVSASASYTFTNGLVTWPLASLTNGGSTNFSVTVTAPASGSLTNRVSAGGATIDPIPGNNDGTAANAIVTTAITPVADLQATKVGPATVLAATNLSYTITLTNLGPSTASSVVVTDALPVGVTFVAATPGYAITSNVLTWALSSLAGGTATNFTVTVTAPAGGTLTNRVLAGSATFDPVINNNNGTTTNSVVVTAVTPVADVQTTKSGPSTMGAGTNIIYTISVTNAGPSTAANVAVIDSLPPGVTVINVSSGGVAATNSVTWPGLTLTNGAATNFTVTITAASGPITNIVSSTSDAIDPVPANNNGTAPSARVITTINSGVAVSGFVYNDANQNGFRDNSEAGTGLTLYTKIFPASTPTGPAIQAVAVNPAAGTYSFSNIAVGTYVIIVDDNNTLSDVTPNIPSGWTGIESPALIRNNIAVANTAVVNQNFGLIQAVMLKGIVFKDTGVSGGTANDGIKNGAEVGIGTVVVKLTDASGATTYSTATTAADGSYTLTIPGAVTNGVQLRVVENNLTGYRSTGASVGNTGGTYSRTNDVVTFTYAAGTVYTGVDFGDVPENEFLTDGQQSGLPGSILVYSHSFTAGSAGSVTFSTTKISTPNIPGWSSVIYRDNNCNSQLDGGDTIVTGPITVATDEKICLLVKEFIPAGAPFGAQDQVTISASLNYLNATPALCSVQTRVDLTTVGTPTTAGLSLLKEVDKASAAPGEVITYTITYLNASSGSLSNIIIYDATPAYTKFYSATNGVMGAGLNSVDIAVPAVGESGSVRWTFSGALAPEGKGNVIYKVTIE